MKGFLMKGMIFTELEDMVDKIYGPDMMQDVIDECDLPSKGAYTFAGTYDYNELITLVSVLSKKLNIPFKDLIFKYAHHLFYRFHDLMPQFFEKPKNSFDFLESVDDYIHVEVRKLYPEAELPKFETLRVEDHKMIVTYLSKRPFSDFAEGLLYGCIDFYEEKISVKIEDKNTDDTYCRIFILEK